jgi:hypothetical protein
MNAQTKGRGHGFAARLSYSKISKAAFQRIGIFNANENYHRAESRQNYLEGWMENWKEPHPQDCTCSTCELVRSETQTY